MDGLRRAPLRLVHGIIRQRTAHAAPVTTADWSAKAGYEAALRLADDPSVAAVSAANDPFALGAIKAFDERGIDVPGRVSVVGFDNVPEERYYKPSLTTVVLDFEEIGYRAVDQILTMTRGGETQLIPLIEPHLIVRDSTGSVLNQHLRCA